jgi:lipopolysaccharide heptosyltransferase II
MPVPHDRVQRLLVRGPNWLGDAVMCEPALRGLRHLFPEADISLLVKPPVAELLLGHPAVNQIVVYDASGRHAGLSGKWALARQLRRQRFDLAVLFQNAFEAALLVWLTGIPRRYGYATDGRSVLLTEPIAAPDKRLHLHQVHYYWNLLKPLGLHGDPPAPELFVSETEQDAMARRLGERGIGKSAFVIGINPGSIYGGAKRWLPDRFADTTERLGQSIRQSHAQDVAVMIVGAKGEEALGHEIAARLSHRTVVLSGATTIRELMAAAKRCGLLLTNDTGPMHIASAMKVPVVAVFGSTDWRTTSPYGAPQAIVRHPVECAPCLLRECPIDHRCMTGVSVEQVYETAVKQLRWQEASDKGQAAGVGEPVVVSRPSASSLSPHASLAGVTVFLDRDGTLNYDSGYLKSAAELRLLPDVAAALARLKTAGARLVVVTNQSGISRGFLTLKDLEAIHARLQGMLEQEDAALDAIYFCPHHPDDGCRCRKPGTAMVERAISELQLDLKRSYVVGNHIRDVQLARNVGAKAILLASGQVDAQAREVLKAEQAEPDVIVASMVEAAEWILADATAS